MFSRSAYVPEVTRGMFFIAVILANLGTDSGALGRVFPPCQNPTVANAWL